MSSLTLNGDDGINSTTNSSVSVSGSTVLSGSSIRVGGSGGGTFNSGDVSFRSTGTVNVTESSATRIVGRNSGLSVALRSETGGITIDGTLTVDDEVTLESRGSAADIVIANNLTTANGAVTVAAWGNVLVTPIGSLNSAGGNIRITADSDGTGTHASGAFRMEDGAVIDAGAGEIDVVAPVTLLWAAFAPPARHV
ncbi:MAG UNVERIFIED_CONTAM: hypothetical protein LVR18_47185 [Planctomycetaceae bacterium]